MRRCLFACLTFAMVAGQQCIPSPDPTDEIPELDEELPRVTLNTSEGDIVIEVFEPESGPGQTFLDLLESGYYDNKIVHDVRKGKWVLAGDYSVNLDEGDEEKNGGGEYGNGQIVVLQLLLDVKRLEQLAVDDPQKKNVPSWPKPTVPFHFTRCFSTHPARCCR